MKHTPLTSQGFAGMFPVAPAELDRLAAYIELLNHWQRRINLVGASTLDDPWRRHVLDSAQLLPLLPLGTAPIVDLGSGAGFPGLVLAILAQTPVELVESDRRKCAFLAEAARVTETTVRIHCLRAESAAPQHAGVVTARALAPLSQLLGYALNWLTPKGICLLLKGRSTAAELTAAAESWTMHITTRPSLSDPEGVVLMLRELARRDAR